MQGVFLHGSRPLTKKALKEVVEAIPVILTMSEREAMKEKAHPLGGSDEIIDGLRTHKHDGYCVVLEATSVFGNEYDGSLANAPKASTYTVVGPDPYTSRKWYATISFDDKTAKWKVK